MRKALLVVLILILGTFLLNIEVSTRQGINYRVQELSIPLYLKLLDFFDRHFNYSRLVKIIIRGAKTDQERVMKIFEWTHQNIRKSPGALPVIDDHVWYTIVRGYGVDDQFQDVFTTLCNYAKVKAFFVFVTGADNQRKKPLSFVKLKNGWSVFDAYEGVYFKNAKGEIANLEDLSVGNWQAFSVFNPHTFDYKAYFKNLKSCDYESWKSSRAAIQSPINRLLFWKKNNS